MVAIEVYVVKIEGMVITIQSTIQPGMITSQAWVWLQIQSNNQASHSRLYDYQPFKLLKLLLEVI